MVDRVYSIEYAIAEGGKYNDPRDHEGIAATALKAIGLTENATGEVTRVYDSSYPDQTGWGVDVPAGRSDEYARQLWKDSRTKSVKIDRTPFPKPAEPTAEDIQKEFDAFKAKVVKVAFRTKETEGWCNDGFKAAMDELGLEVPKKKARVVLEFEVGDWGTDFTDLESTKDHVRWNMNKIMLENAVVSTETFEA